MSLKSEGRAPFKVGDETFETWYQIFGYLDLKVKSQRPLLLLHGGPGMNCLYFENLVDLWTEYKVPVIAYDQLGCGNSTHLPHKGCEFWTLDLFRDELENLLVYLGIHEYYHMLGHSWGGILGSYFIATRNPSGLGKFIISNSTISISIANESELSIAGTLPKDIYDEILKHDEGEKYDEELFQKGTAMYHEQFVCRLTPTPVAVTNTYEIVEKEPTVRRCTMGSDKFLQSTGTFKDLTMAPYLPKIQKPVLLISGEYDMIQDMGNKPIFELLSKVKWMKLKDTSHMPFYEMRDKYMKIIYDFLQDHHYDI